jgi:hypothetical protein
MLLSSRAIQGKEVLFSFASGQAENRGLTVDGRGKRGAHEAAQQRFPTMNPAHLNLETRDLTHDST